MSNPIPLAKKLPAYIHVQAYPLNGDGTPVLNGNGQPEPLLTRKGDPKWTLICEVLDGPARGRSISETLSFGPNAQDFIKHFFAKLGLIRVYQTAPEFKPELLDGMRCWIKCGRYDEKGYARISHWTPMSAAEAAAQPSAMVEYALASAKYSIRVTVGPKGFFIVVYKSSEADPDQDPDLDYKNKNKINGTVVKVFYTCRSTTPVGTCKKLLHVCINGHQFLSRSPPTRCPRCLTTYVHAAEFEFC